MIPNPILGRYENMVLNINTKLPTTNNLEFKVLEHVV